MILQDGQSGPPLVAAVDHAPAKGILITGKRAHPTLNAVEYIKRERHECGRPTTQLRIGNVQALAG